MRHALSLLALAVVWTLPAQAQPAENPPTPPAPETEAQPPRLKIGADASLASVIPALAQAWADQTDGPPVVELELTDAGTLNAHLGKGHPWDIVLVAGREAAQGLTTAGRLRSGGQKLIAQTRLGVFGKAALIEDEMLDWYDLVRQEWGPVVIGDPLRTASGPAAKALMEQRGVYGTASKKLQLVTNTPAGLDKIQRGEGDAIIAFAPELIGTTLPGYQHFKVDKKMNPPVFYVGAVTANSAAPPLAESFIQFLVSPEAEPIWRQHGYLD